VNFEERQSFTSMEAKMAALSTEVRLHHEMVQDGLKSLNDSVREQNRSSRDEITILTQTVRTVSEWQIGHANSTYHRDLADRLTEVEANLLAIAEIHIERRLKESAEDRQKIREEALKRDMENTDRINKLGAKVSAIEQKSHDEEVAAGASNKLLKRQSAAIAFLISVIGSGIGILVGLNLA
jgi:hypothetical protein